MNRRELLRAAGAMVLGLAAPKPALTGELPARDWKHHAMLPRWFSSPASNVQNFAQVFSAGLNPFNQYIEIVKWDGEQVQRIRKHLSEALLP